MESLPHILYGIVAKETGEGGLEHFQCYMYFSTPKTTKQIIAMIGMHAHTSVMRTNPKASSDYCKKDGNFVEFGEVPPSQGHNGGLAMREKYDTTLKLAKMNKIQEIDAEMQLKHYSTLKKVAADNRKIPPDLDWVDGNTPNEWLWGPTGTGKSRKARTENPGAYIKMTTNEWWEDYADESVVIIEDISPYEVKLGTDLKIWADRYGFRANVKHSSNCLRPKKIIVTSNYSIRQIFQDRTTYEPLERRFRSIYMGNCPKHNFECSCVAWQPPAQRPSVETVEIVDDENDINLLDL